jgi:Tfp pilus assembly protein PilE
MAGRGARGRSADDGGVALIEALVAVAVMSIVGTIITASMIQINVSTNRNEALSRVASQLHIAFSRLDGEVRYATGITSPNPVRSPQGFLYVEYAVAEGTATRCTQLRAGGADGVLQRRLQSGTAAAGSWTTIATGIGTASFELRRAATGQFPHDQLTITLEPMAGAGSSPTARRAEYTFTALNTSIETPADVCPTIGRP